MLLQNQASALLKLVDAICKCAGEVTAYLLCFMRHMPLSGQKSYVKCNRSC